MMKKLTQICFLLFLSVMQTWCFLAPFVLADNDNKPFYIGVAGPLTGSGKNSFTEMKNGIELALHNNTQNNEINGQKIKLVFFDDRNDKNKAVEIAQKIAEENEVLMVLGHYYSSASIAAGKIYEKFNIPAITASATADRVSMGNDFYFQIIPNNAFQAGFIAHYIKRVLKQSSACVLYDKDEYGTSLYTNFVKTAKKLDIDIKLTWGFNSDNQHWENEWETVLKKLKKLEDPGIIFLPTHVQEGSKIISSLKYPGSNMIIFGPDSFGGKNFLNEITKYPLERAKPGYYSNDIYALSPFVIDLAGSSAHLFRSDYINEYDKEPSWVSAGYYDALLLALDALKNAGLTQTDTTLEKRLKIKDHLSSINTHKKAINGVNGLISFNMHGGVVRPMAVATFQDQKLVSAPAQYSLINDVRDIDNLMSEVLKGNIIKINDKFMIQTRVVYTGIDVNEISDLDVIDQSYIVDFYIWFRYQGEFDYGNVEFINAENPIELDKKKRTLRLSSDIIAKILEKKNNGYTTQAFRIKAIFQSDFDFHEYPFDKQTLSIQFRHSKETRDKLIYVLDLLGMRHFREANTGEDLEYNSIPGWDAKKEYFFQNVVTNDSTLGDPDFFNTEKVIQYSQCNTSILIKRQVVGFLFKDIFSVVIMLMTLYIIYFISNERFELRLSIGMGVLMTNAFLHQDVSSALQVGYLLTIDYAFFTVYGLSTIAIVVSLMGNKYYQLEKFKSAARLDILGKVIHPLVIASVTLIIMFAHVL